MSISCNIFLYKLFIWKMYVVCVDAKYTYFAHSMLHVAVITGDIIKCSTRERVRLAGH